MWRIVKILIALLVAMALILSAGCKKEHLKDTADEEDPGGPGPEGPPTPGVK